MHHRWPLDYLNLKCVVFSFYVALAYWYFPRDHPALFVLVNFLLTNWYNSSYECAHNSLPLNAAIALIASVVLWKVPTRNKYWLVVLLYLPYLIMAWYDYLLNCNFRMNPTIFPFGRWVYLPFKPPTYKRKFENIDEMVLKNIKAFDKYVVILLSLLASLFVVRRVTTR